MKVKFHFVYHLTKETMIKFLNEKYLNRLFHVQLHQDENIEEILAARQAVKNAFESNVDPAMQFNPAMHRKDPKVTIRTNVKAEDRVATDPSTWGKVGRNDDCPCKSGKKYKQCHGKI